MRQFCWCIYQIFNLNKWKVVKNWIITEQNSGIKEINIQFTVNNNKILDSNACLFCFWSNSHKKIYLRFLTVFFFSTFKIVIEIINCYRLRFFNKRPNTFIRWSKKKLVCFLKIVNSKDWSANMKVESYPLRRGRLNLLFPQLRRILRMKVRIFKNGIKTVLMNTKADLRNDFEMESKITIKGRILDTEQTKK